MLEDAVYTLEEVAEYLRVPIESVEREIAAGRLGALGIDGGLVRVLESQLNSYKNEAQVRRVSVAEGKTRTAAAFQLVTAPDFMHTWPDGKREHFTSVTDGVAAYAGRNYAVKVGFTTRHSAGKDRRRSLVLVDRYPTVEFVAADTRENTARMASIIKDRLGKQLPARASVPPEYKDLAVGSYREVVDGPGASNGLAVICDSEDLETMVKHALIRYRYRQERPKE